jgi:phosphoribosylanthranilate isomerase
MIKINHLTNLHDARFAAAENVDFISFAMAKGNMRKIPLSLYQDITQWIAGTYLVLDFEEDANSLLETLNKSIPFDFLQVHASIIHFVPTNLLERTFVFCPSEFEALNFLEQSFIVESYLDIQHDKHFQIVHVDCKKENFKNYTLDYSFFLENYELDYELFNKWNAPN